jgi:hypothetical protein
MALIVLQHTAVDNYDVDPQYSIEDDGRILAGSLVGIDTDGFVAKAGNNGSSGVQPMGIAGDSISDEYRTTAYSAQLIIGRGQRLSDGTYSAPRRWNSNRLSDNYNEAQASGKMSVYIGAGRFATDQYVTSDSWSTAHGKKVYSNSAGLFTLDTGTSARPVGYVIAPPAAYPSGVPGADAPVADGSMSLGTFLQVSLSI